MPEQKTAAVLVAAATLLALTGCETAPAPVTPTKQDVEFLRGCWVQKTAPGGPITSFLRLLPEGADGPAYRGEVQRVSDGLMTATYHLSFERDGSTATFPLSTPEGISEKTFVRERSEMYDTPPAQDYRRAVYVRADDSKALLIAEAQGESLKIFTTRKGSQTSGVLFQGERDGCD